MIDFGVVKGPASNALLKRYNSNAAYKQSEQEKIFEESLRKAYRNPDYQATPKYNDAEDREPRKPLTPSSSWIEGVTYDPDTMTANITVGGIPYTFGPAYGNAFTPDEMAEFINSSSLGQWLWDNNKFISKHRK